jgi:tetrapyrrole methylase family protein/MazG family protein
MKREKKMLEMIRFVEIVRQLRSDDGCPWDRAQTHSSLRRCLVEEAGEFLDAVEEGEFEGMQEELGDLLLQVVLHSQLASEAGKFTLEDVVRAECEKLLRRHPHVFGGGKASSAAEALRNWERSKAGESGSQQRRLSAMDGVPRSLPALSRAQKTLSKAGKSGFEWNSVVEIVAKIDEELREVKEALGEGDRDHLEEEIGDLLFAIVNLCRWQKTEAEETLHGAIGKFIKRFRSIEAETMRQGKSLAQLSAPELNTLWEKTKPYNSNCHDAGSFDNGTADSA